MNRLDVIGGGIFGCTTAILAARRGLEVHLYERETQLLTGASGHNQWRLHRGYHYPRSLETGEECREGILGFMELFGFECLQRRRDSWYGIVDSGRTTVSDYRKFLCDSPLDYDSHRTPPFTNVGWAFQPNERLIDPWTFAAKIEQLLLVTPNVRVHLGEVRHISEHPTVVAVYYETNDLIAGHGLRDVYRYQIVEKPIVELDPEYENLSAVILDGPYGSVDPYGNSGCHLVGHVQHAVHWQWTTADDWSGPAWAHRLVNKGIHRAPPVSNWAHMQRDIEIYLPAIRDARYLGSMFTVRCVHGNAEATDERLTDVTKVNDNCVTIVSGKIPTCVTAATKALDLLGV